MTARLLVLAAILLALTGGVFAWAASEDPGSDPAPPAATRDVPGLVSLARPVRPIAVPSDPPSTIELRVKPPGGRERYVAVFQETRTRTGRKVDRQCTLLGPLKQLRSTKKALGNCLDRSVPGAWSIVTGAGSDGSVTLDGIVSERVRRVTVAGPGGTFVVPVSPGGAFHVAYGRRASGRAVLTAMLDDGSTRFFRTAVPPEFESPGSVKVPDPEGLPSWRAGADLRTIGPRKGQVCTQVTQASNIRARGLQAGGTFLAPVCGEARATVFARTVRTAPSRELRTFGAARVPRRTVLVGALRKDVRSVALVGPQGRRQLELADAGRAFLAVFPARVTPDQLTLEATLADGSVERYANPVAVNRATTENPPPRLRGRPTLTRLEPGSRRVAVELRLTGPAARVEVTLLGREVRLRRIGSSTRYRGVYDGTRGARRTFAKLQRFSLLICGDTCSTQLQRARLR